MSFSFQPDYRFYLQKLNPSTGAVDTYRLWTMTSCQASLVTGNGQNQLTAVFADPGKRIRRGLQPHDMNVVQLVLKNRFGKWAIAWTGIVDEVHYTWEAQSGDSCQIKASSAWKLWEITQETYTDAMAMTYSFIRNVTGSNVLRYSANAVGFRQDKLIIDPLADAGTGYSTSAPDNLGIDPNQQYWSSVMQGFLADSGLELFIDEESNVIYRQVQFINNKNNASPRGIDGDEVISYDIIEMDEGVVTDLQVRWGAAPAYQTQGWWSAPDAMRLHLRKRNYVAYAPWIQGSNGNIAAAFLAGVLGPQMAAGLLRATYTIPADPFFRLGTIIKVPSFNDPRNDNPYNDGSRIMYYVSSITYQLTWGSSWVMTLGLTYGRPNNESFPYLQGQTVGYPVLTAEQAAHVRASMPRESAPISVMPASMDRPSVYGPFTVLSTSGLSSDQVYADQNLFPVGTVLQVRDAKGNPIGPSHNGDYTVVGGGGGISGAELGMQGTTSATAIVTVVKRAPSGAPTTAAPKSVYDPSQGSATRPSLTPVKGTGNGTGATQPYDPPLPRDRGQSSIAMQALQLGLSVADQVDSSGYTPNPHYKLGWHGETASNGQRYWDCSGLVYWAYNQLGFTDVYPPSGSQWYSFQKHGAVPITVDQAQVGDLLFIGPGVHVAWCYKAGGFASGQTYGANNSVNGLRVYDIAGYHGENGEAFDCALSMANIHT